MQKDQFTPKINFKIQDCPLPPSVPNQIPTPLHFFFIVLSHPQIVALHCSLYSRFVTWCFVLSSTAPNQVKASLKHYTFKNNFIAFQLLYSNQNNIRLIGQENLFSFYKI